LKLPAVNWRSVALLVAVAAVTAGAYPLSRWLLNRPIETIVINGSFQRVSPIQLEAQVEPYAHAGFLDVDLGAVRHVLTALPWVASVEVRRKWPGTLEIQVKEETPVACWGERGLLNSAGELFLANADHVPAELPRLHGPAGTEAQVTARYFAVQERLEHRGMTATTLTLDGRGAWSFTTSSGLQVRLGAKAVDQRIERFFDVLDGTLAHLAGEVDYVDMRYPNGFAVGWKNQQPARAAAAQEPQPHA
jgi:cell division protein FtsQ